MFGGENVMSIQPWDTQSDRLLCIKDSNVARFFISLLIREGDYSVQSSRDFSGGTTGLSSPVNRVKKILVSFSEQQHFVALKTGHCLSNTARIVTLLLISWSSGVAVTFCGTL